ncbi:protein ref(2)P-like [Anastrepha ludens]|uniref:protein ref(2)P-like n=1 Tax=Anastrepha ludens TaxID=28586 RepID=UPI0023B1CDA5|nr:protein ref(2)P-like [Anastrepha ludens]
MYQKRRSNPAQNFFKITYTDGDHKLNYYMWYPPLSYEGLINGLYARLFEERKLPKCELRIYWLDEDSDQIDVLSEDDYNLFLQKNGAKDHLFVVPKAVKKEETHEKKAEHADVSSEQPKTNGQPTAKQ